MAEPLLVACVLRGLVDGRRQQQVVVDQHHVGNGRAARHQTKLTQPVGLVDAAAPDLDDESAPRGLHHPHAGPERSHGVDWADGALDPRPPAAGSIR